MDALCAWNHRKFTVWYEKQGLRAVIDHVDEPRQRGRAGGQEVGQRLLFPGIERFTNMNKDGGGFGGGMGEMVMESPHIVQNGIHPGRNPTCRLRVGQEVSCVISGMREESLCKDMAESSPDSDGADLVGFWLHREEC